MFTHRQTYLRKALTFTVMMLLLLNTTGRSEALSASTPTTVSPSLSNSSLTDPAVNSSMGQPNPPLLARPCGAANANYCLNDGKCMHPQDSNRPFCICTPSYQGARCEIYSDLTYRPLAVEKVIAIIFGMLMVLIVLVLVTGFFVKRRCVKSAPLIKAAASETSV